MAKTNNLTDFLIDLADSIREIEGSSDAINPQDFHDRIINSQPTIYNGETELLVPAVSGVWKFNDALPLFEANETVKFTSNSEDYNGITLYDTGADGLQVLYKHGADDHTVTYEFDSWSGEAYRTVDFGTEPQEVSEEFYIWLTANAVKQ